MSTALVLSPLPDRLANSSGVSLAPVELMPFTPVQRLQAMLEANYTTKIELEAVLTELYGAALLQRVQNSEMCASWPHQLQRRHILEMLAALGHSITLADLNEYLVQLQQNNVQAQILRLFNIEQPHLTLQNLARIEDLPAQHMQTCMELFRNPLKFLYPDQADLVLWEQLEGSRDLTDKRCLRYTSYDYAVHRSFREANRDRAEFPFAAPELLAKHIGYAKPESITDGMVIPVFRNENGPEIVYYQLASHVNESGLHAYLFKPINRPEMPAQLVFRGTNGIESTQRDLDTTGVGKAVFDQNAPAIVRMVETYCNSVMNPSIEISGHSLGAGDAQRAGALLVDHGVKNQQSSIANLQSIKVFAYCAPKLDTATVQNWDANLQTLANREWQPRIELNFALHQSDFVTWAGDFYLHGANASFINCNYLLVKSPSGVLSEMTHHTKPFFLNGNFDSATDRRTFLLFQDAQYRETREQMFQMEERRLIPVQVHADGESHQWDLLLGEQEFNDSLTEDQRIQRAEIHQLIEILDRTRAEIQRHQRGWAQHSWIVWAASWVAQPLKAVLSATANLIKV